MALSRAISSALSLDLGSDHIGGRMFGRQRQGYGAAAGADVEYTRSFGAGLSQVREALQSHLDQGLCLGSRDQRVTVDLQLYGAKRLAPADIRDRFVGLATTDKFLKTRPIGSAERQLTVGVQRLTMQTQDLAEQDLGVEARRGRSAGAQTFGSGADRLLDRRRRHSWRRSLRRRRRPRCPPGADVDPAARPAPASALGHASQLLASIFGGQRLGELVYVALEDLV